VEGVVQGAYYEGGTLVVRRGGTTSIGGRGGETSMGARGAF